MTKVQELVYENSQVLKSILIDSLKGRKFKLDCGHHVTFGHFLGNDIIIYNGKNLKIICTQCGY